MLDPTIKLHRVEAECDALKAQVADLTAKLHESEFRHEHRTNARDGWRWCEICDWTACDNPNDTRMNRCDGDPRHDYDHAAWLKVAEQELPAKSE